MQPQVCCERRGPQAGSSLVCGAGAALGVQRLSRRQASPTTALLTRPNRPATKARPSPEAREREREGARAGRRGPGVVQHGVVGGGKGLRGEGRRAQVVDAEGGMVEGRRMAIGAQVGDGSPTRRGKEARRGGRSRCGGGAGGAKRDFTQAVQGHKQAQADSSRASRTPWE